MRLHLTFKTEKRRYVKYGIVNGKPGNNGDLYFDPEAFATKAELSKMVHAVSFENL